MKVLTVNSETESCTMGIAGKTSHLPFTSSSWFSASNNNKIENFLRVYFDFAFYICCSPFHFTFDRNNGCYRIKTWKPQQVVCALLHILGILRLVTEVREDLPMSIQQSPVDYFLIVGAVFRILFKILTIKEFWCNQKLFLDIVNFASLEKNLPDCHLKIQNKYVISTGAVLCVIMPIIYGMKNEIFASPAMWNSTWWDHRLISDGRFAFFLIGKSEYLLRNSSNHSASYISVLDYFLASTMGIGLIERHIIGFYFDTSLLCAVLTLWSSSYAFSNSLSNMSLMDSKHLANFSSTDHKSVQGCSMKAISEKNDNNWTGLYEAYKGIRSLSQIINSAFGNMITAFLAESILYHSMNMDAVILTKDYFKQAYLSFFIINSCLTHLYAADICNQMDALKVWLSKDENRKNVPLDELNMILHELQASIIGIRGSNIFTITYSLVWNMLTTVVTYFVICMQARTYTGNA